MYGAYIIAIASGAAAVLFGLIGLILCFFWHKAEKKREELYVNGFSSEYQKYDNKADALDTWTGVIWGFAIFFIAVAIIAPIAGAITLRNAEYEYETFLVTQDVFDQVYKEENQFENIMLTQEMLDRNEWLVKAKASKKTYGCFSKYYYLDLDALKPIGTRV